MEVVEVSQLDRGFADEVEHLSHAGLRRCYACRTCGNGCPFVEAMAPPPYGIIRMVLLGMREQALASPTIWICVNCHTCSSQCPMGIDIAAMMNVLCHLALKERARVVHRDILDFHLEVLRTVETYGRTHKLGIMLQQMTQQAQMAQQQEAQALAQQAATAPAIPGGQGFNPAMGGMPPAAAFPEATRESGLGQKGMGEMV